MQLPAAQLQNDFNDWRRDSTTRKFFRRVAALRKLYVDKLVNSTGSNEFIRENLGIIKGLEEILTIDADDFKEENLEPSKDEV